MKHTPGKWEIRGQRIWSPALKIGDIAHVYCKSVSNNADFESDEMGKANAALLALSPELLDFAIQVKYSLGGGCDPWHDACPYTNAELIEMANQLIAKAEGVQDAETD
uniref:Uncharacterized protein n=1 Tax=viral metagenome TaxID=1070528 RepID=A0A6M3JP99_9ZZZZ